MHISLNGGVTRAGAKIEVQCGAPKLIAKHALYPNVESFEVSETHEKKKTAIRPESSEKMQKEMRRLGIEPRTSATSVLRSPT